MRLKNRLLPVLAIATALVIGTAGLASANLGGGRPSWEGPFDNLTECLQAQDSVHGEILNECNWYLYGPVDGQYEGPEGYYFEVQFTL